MSTEYNIASPANCLTMRFELVTGKHGAQGIAIALAANETAPATAFIIFTRAQGVEIASKIMDAVDNLDQQIIVPRRPS